MAFNFNWSPLTADADFYTRAKELLTAALNKSPKPPIIVDDVLVNELNLGSVPPDLEILEIGDLAEDRFRGIFKMCYSGDAFLTLKTRVQANPLNTYLSTRPTFASPEPLAAASGLTIPLKITLSDIKLSAFIILVFSRQKGLTLVFRNDPLESLKVSSTFDSIPFVREYLQKEIEGQLRTLLMDEVPAIIHRLSLRLWVPEYRTKDDREAREANAETTEPEPIIDPLASPPQDPVDSLGHVLDPAQITSLSLDSTTGPHSLFSQKNLLRLAALTNSHRTLSLSTPNMKDVIFRAWPGPMERRESLGIVPPNLTTAALMARKQSHVSVAGTASSCPDGSSQAIRPPLTSFGSSYHLSGLPSKKAARKRKHRVVNLRRHQSDFEDVESVSGESLSATLSSEASAPSEAGLTPLQEARDEPITPPLSPTKLSFRDRFGSNTSGDDKKNTDATPRPIRHDHPPLEARLPLKPDQEPLHAQASPPDRLARPGLSRYFASYQYPQEAQACSSHAATLQSPLLAAPFPYVESSPGGILEQAWMMKMAGEIARRVQDQKASGAGIWDSHLAGSQDSPPPAYTS